MGIIAWIDVGLTAGLPANIPLPGKRTTGPYFHLPACFTGALGASWVRPPTS